jgi:hypothetical protein
MSIIARLRQITPDQVKQFSEHPDEAYQLILGDSHEAATETSRELEDWKRRNAVVLLQAIAAGKLENLSPGARAEFDKVHQEFSEIARKSVTQAMAAFQAGKLPKKKKTTGISLEKAWHGIHFLLTGQAEGGEPPLAWAVPGHREIPDRQKLMGQGPARLLTPEEVQQVSAALSKVKQKQLGLRYDVKAMERARLYAVRGEIEFEYFWAYLMVLKAYYAQAAKLRKGMLSYLE